MKKKGWLCVTAVLLLALTAAAVWAAPADNVPTLFHNDEVWYKDETASALLKDGVFHVPSDFIAMFDYITVATERDGENLLFVNEQTGDYVSVLYSSRVACVNGNVVEDISIFRENGYYYLDVDFLCRHLSLSVEYSREANITDRSVRVYDGEKMTGFEELLAAYAKEDRGETEEETEASETLPPEEAPEEHRVRIRLICAATETSERVLAWSIADRLGFSYSLFFTSEISLSRLQSVSVSDSVGLAVSSADEARALNERLAEVFFRKTHLALSTGDGLEDAALRRMGYLVLRPDFTVEVTTDAAVMFEELVASAEPGDTVTIFLGDVWQSETLLLYLETLDRTKYDIGKRSDSE